MRDEFNWYIYVDEYITAANIDNAGIFIIYTQYILPYKTYMDYKTETRGIKDPTPPLQNYFENR